ncbi:MAG: hypothetical protein ACI97A_001399 [Planctomycetota bacterium]|jgi:hypothetical protein
MTKSCTWMLFAAILIFSAQTQAQTPIDLRFNGEQNAVAAIGSTMTITADTATPFVWGTLIFSTSPGPTNVLGFIIPIGIDASTVIAENVLFGMTGNVTISVPLLNDLAFEGTSYYAYAFTFDPTDPSGFGASNQAKVTFSRHLETGADTAGFVDQSITLDGGAILNQGPVHPDLSISWSIVNGPVGHAAVLAGDDTAFPALTADLPGTYEVQLSYSFPGTTGGAAQSVFVDVLELDVTSHAQGSFDTSDPINYAATVNGPATSNFEVSGGPSTTGNSLAGSVAASAIVSELDFQITSALGQKLGSTTSVINNLGGDLTMPPADSLGLHLKQPVLDDLETGLETALAGINLSSMLGTFPAIPLTGIPGVSGTATIQSFSFDPTIDVELSFVPGAINAQLTITNIQLVFTINGTLFGFIPLNETGTYNATSMVVSIDLVPAVAGGVLTTTTANETATISGDSLTLTGALSGSGGLLVGTITPLIESTVITALPPLLPPLIDGALNALPTSIDLSGQGIDITLAFEPSSVSVVAGSMDLGYAAGAQANNIAPGTPTLTNFYATPSALPVYGPVVPGTTQVYIGAGSVGDDMINQILAAATEAGALEVSIDQDFMVGGATIPATAGAFATAFPMAGFDTFPAAAPVRLAVHQNLAPIVTIDNMGGMSNYALHTSNVLLDVMVEISPGYEVSALRLSASATTALTVNVDLVAGTLDLLPGTTVATVKSITSMPGTDPSTALAGLSALVNSSLPSILSPISGIPLPALMIGTTIPTIVGIEADGAAGDYLSIFVN